MNGENIAPKKIPQQNGLLAMQAPRGRWLSVKADFF
jgi:hypothetical protein